MRTSLRSLLVRMKVEVFSVGVRPELFGFTGGAARDGWLAVISIGGYVRFVGGREAASAADGGTSDLVDRDARQQESCSATAADAGRDPWTPGRPPISLRRSTGGPAESRRWNDGESFVAPGSACNYQGSLPYKGWRVPTVWECALKGSARWPLSACAGFIQITDRAAESFCGRLPQTRSPLSPFPDC